MEKWRDIPGYEGFYQASNAGRIRSLSRHVRTKGGALRLSRGRVLAGCGPRYDLVRLSVDGKQRTGLVHRLVCAAFHGRPPLEMHAAHIDGNAKNNRADNLRWATAKENCADRATHGTQVRGARVNTAKLSEDDVLAIRMRLRCGATTKALAVEYRVHRSNIQQIMRGAIWKHLTA